MASAKKLLGVLEARGWRRDDAGAPGAFRYAAGDVTVVWPIDPGFEIELLRHAPPQTTAAARIEGAAGALRPWGSVDAALASEVLRDAELLRGVS